MRVATPSCRRRSATRSAHSCLRCSPEHASPLGMRRNSRLRDWRGAIGPSIGRCARPCSSAGRNRARVPAMHPSIRERPFDVQPLKSTPARLRLASPLDRGAAKETQLGALHVGALGGVDLDFRASGDEGRHLHRNPGLQPRRLEGRRGSRVLDARLGVDHGEHHGRRQLHADGAVVVEVDLDVGVGKQVAGLALEEVRRQRELLVVFLVHEDVAVAVLVEVLHVARVDERPLDLVLGAEALVGLGARLDVLHLHLHEGAAAAAHVHVIALQHAPDALVPFQQVAGTDADCFDLGHDDDLPLGKRPRFYTFYNQIIVFDAKSFVAGLPNLPGVYRMLGKEGDALYVGKARDLKKRVASYFQKQAQSPRIEMMLSQVASMEVTATRSEGEALLLENNLIKSLDPRYNILFRDDKSYPYLMVSGHEYPRLGFHRGAKDKKHRYFGPFPHAYAVRESIQLLQRVFRLRTCEDTVFENRSRPCLLYQIRRCTAPCTGRISAELYAEDVRNAELFLEGREDDVMRKLNLKMQTASEDRHYEEAALYRDQIRALARVQARQYVESHRGVDADVVACVIEGGVACVNLVMIRRGRHVGDRSFFPANAEGAAPAEVVAAFLEQHYLEQPVPGLVIASEPVEGFDAVTPSHGERRVWLDMATKNAQLAIVQRVRDRATQETRLFALREVLGLPEGANRIECFDI